MALSHSISGLAMRSARCSLLGIVDNERQRRGACAMSRSVSQGSQSLHPISDVVMPSTALPHSSPGVASFREHDLVSTSLRTLRVPVVPLGNVAEPIPHVVVATSTGMTSCDQLSLR